MYIYDNILLNSPQDEKCFKVVEKIKTHVLCSRTFSDNRAVYEIMCKNMLPAGQATGDSII
jgi:hypothetical protein